MSVIRIEVTDEFAEQIAKALRKLTDGGNTASPLAVSNPVNEAAAQQPQAPSDPWANGASTQPQNAPVPAVQGGQPVAQMPTPQVQGPPQPVAPAMAQPAQPVTSSNAWPQPGTYNVNGQNGPQTAEVGNPAAPNCDHGVPAVLITGLKKDKPQGSTDPRDYFRAWRCALSITNDWKNKCKTNKWA